MRGFFSAYGNVAFPYNFERDKWFVAADWQARNVLLMERHDALCCDEPTLKLKTDKASAGFKISLTSAAKIGIIPLNLFLRN